MKIIIYIGGFQHTLNMLNRFALSLLLIFISGKTNAQFSDSLLLELTPLAKKIMLELQIPTRKNIRLDDPLKIIIDSGAFAFNAKFGTLHEHEMMAQGNDFSTRYYINPVIKISPLIYLVLSKRKDTTFIAYLKAKTIVIHEIAHYLQQTYDGNKHTDDQLTQLYIPVEFEAFSVGTYFFFSVIKPKLLGEIMSSRQPLRKKEEALINAFQKVIYPWRPAPF